MNKNIELTTTALMDLADANQWRTITLLDIATQSMLETSDILQFTHNKMQILSLYFDKIDQIALSNLDHSNETAKEYIFDFILCHIEALSPRKNALKNISKAMISDPIESIKMLAMIRRSLKLMFESAGFSISGIKGNLALNSVKVLYLRALQVWLCQSNDDLSSTMAEIDKRIRQTEFIFDWLDQLKQKAPLYQKEGGT